MPPEALHSNDGSVPYRERSRSKTLTAPANGEPMIRRFVGGPLMTTCYVVIDPGRGTVIIDAPREAWKGALAAAEREDAPVRLVIATHGDWDHISDMARLQELGYPIAGHPADNQLFHDPMGNRTDLPFIIDPIHLNHELADGDRLEAGDIEIHVLHTPGHSPGHISLYVPSLDALFTGDTVLKGGAGYLDRRLTDPPALAASVRRIAAFPEHTAIYPGHGAPTTVGKETWMSDAEDAEALIADWKAGRRRWTPRGARAG